MVQQLYELLSNTLFNGNPTTMAYGELFCQGIAIVAVGILVLLPFAIIWRIIRKFL